jgi:hypothetical protein
LSFLCFDTYRTRRLLVATSENVSQACVFLWLPLEFMRRLFPGTMQGGAYGRVF